MENIIPWVEWNVLLTEFKRIVVVNFSPSMENIFTLTENSVPQSENILPQMDHFWPYDRSFM